MSPEEYYNRYGDTAGYARHGVSITDMPEDSHSLQYVHKRRGVRLTGIRNRHPGRSCRMPGETIMYHIHFNRWKPAKS